MDPVVASTSETQRGTDTGQVGREPFTPPFLCGTFSSNRLYDRLNANAVVSRDELDAAIDGERIFWRRRFWLWPLGYGLLVELLWPWLRSLAARRLWAAWQVQAQASIATWGEQIEDILAAGQETELTVQAWFDRICQEQAHGQMHCWMPPWEGITETVFAPSAHNASSQEIDALLVTEHGVYLIEVKGWRQIAADGTGSTSDGQRLASPLAQSRHKRDHLQALLGPQVPVRLLAVLPHLSEDEVPFGLDARILHTESQLQLVLRGAHQRAKDAPRVDVAAVRQTLLAHLDRAPGAKLRHMLWLAAHHPNPEVLAIRDLDAQRQQMQAGLAAPFEFAAREHRPLGLAAALLASVLLLGGGRYPEPYQRLARVVRPAASSSEQAPMPPAAQAAPTSSTAPKTPAQRRQRPGPPSDESADRRCFQPLRSPPCA